MGNSVFRKILVKYFNYKPISVNSVFTPVVSADNNYIPRPRLERQIEKELDTPGMQIILFGPSGSGKTTIIRNVLKKRKSPFIITTCSSGTKFENTLYSGFDQLDKYYISEKRVKRSKKISGLLKSLHSELDGETSYSDESTFLRILSPQLSKERLAKTFGECGITWIIEDFHKVAEEELINFSDMMKVFVNNADEFPSTKMICIGANDYAHELIKKNPNIKNRVAQVHIPMLEENEISAIVKNGTKMLNIIFETSLIEKIVYYSGRIASLAHNMCLDICNEQGIKNRQTNTKYVTDFSFNAAIDGFIERNTDTLTALYDTAVADEIGWHILKTFACNSHEKISTHEILKLMGKKGFQAKPTFDKLNLLASDEYEILFQHKTSGLYSIASPFWKVFLSIQFAKEKDQQQICSEQRKNKNLRLIDLNDKDVIIQKAILDFVKKYIEESEAI